MNLINIEKITKVFAERKIFDQASFFLQEGEKVGIIGINGTGKTTLLKMLAGMEEPDEGTITTANHVVIRYGTPIDPATLSKEEQKHLGAHCREVIVDMLHELV